MSGTHVQLPSEHPICRVLESYKLDERIKASIILVVNNLGLETNDRWLYNKSWLNHHAAHYLRQRVISDRTFKEYRK